MCANGMAFLHAGYFFMIANKGATCGTRVLTSGARATRWRYSNSIYDTLQYAQNTRTKLYNII